MCMEDVRLGRKTGGKVSFITCLNGARTPLCPQDDKRLSLTVSCDGVNTAWLHPTQQPSPGNNGFALVAQTPIYTFTLETHGILVTWGWSAVASAGNPVVSVLENGLEKE